MRTSTFHRSTLAAIVLGFLGGVPSVALAAPNPDLTAAGAIATLKTDPASTPLYGETYNLGATGLRGWIHVGGGNGADGTFTGSSRQILVTVASTPASAVLAVDDVILGAMASSSGTVPAFTSDCRKAFGAAISAAEKTGAGTLRVKRWRAGVTTDENIPMPIMGDYAATAPYNCPKSALILANARNSLVSQLLANQPILTNDWDGAIHGLALLAGVAPADPNYGDVQGRLQTYARARATAGPQQGSLVIWDWAYTGLFLAEYYLSTGDANVVGGINNYTIALAQAQSIYGTFGHSPSVLRPDGSGRRMGIGYGPVNSVGIVANMAIVMGKKALVAAGQAISPEIDPAIQRGSDFFAWYANKGPIPYGEHEPYMENHASNGKDSMCAVFFGLQAGRTVETEYFTRMTTASFNGREYGHTGQGFSFLWGAMGANMGGSLAAAEYLKQVRWHLDLSRRSDGSFAYDGQEQYGAGTTADGTYLGASGYYGMNATASYILTYALPLQQLHITGKNAIPANSLDATKVAHAIAAATFKQDCPGFNTTQLITALSDFDPVVRNYAAIELAKRTLTTAETNTLISMVGNTNNANGRQGACQTLGILKNTTAMPLMTQRLSDPDVWVRAKAATALRSYGATANTQRDSMLTAFNANATDPDVILWNDPTQISNNYLSFALFGDAVYGGNNIATATIAAPKNLLYPAVRAGLKQPDSISRTGAAKFCFDHLPLADVQALIPEFFEVIEIECQADRMWGAEPRESGIKTLSKYKISEGIPQALAMLEIPTGFEWGSTDVLLGGLNALAAYGDASRWTLPTLRGYLGTWSPTSSQYTTLVNTIASIENAITAPAQNLGLAVATSQVVATTAAKAITLTGTSPRTSVTFINVTNPAHGTLTGTAPSLTYTPTVGYTGPDSFTFQTTDGLTTSAPGTIGIIVGTAGTGLKGEYYDNTNFTNLKLTRTDAQVNFDWGTGTPNALLGADTFSVRWSGLLLVPESGTYTFSTLNSDGVRLYINGNLVIDDYVDQTTNWKDGASVNLTAGQMVELQMEYYENTGSAVAKLKWTGPSFAGANGAIIGTQWLFDGTGLPRAPYAHAQTLTLVQNTATAVTLSGSGGALTYTVLAQPTKGTLTGTAPNLIYTPAANFSGSDSFTFLANNGSSNSAPATVSIGIQAGSPQDFFWTTAVSGNWSGATTWSNAAAATVVPAATGQPFYRLSFNKAGTYTATQDLNNGFLLNQLNMAGTVTLAGANSLAFAANGTLLPQFNQNSTNTVSVTAPLSLNAMTSFGGSFGGSVAITGLISGSGGLTKNSVGTLQLYSTTANTYSGGTIINNGTLHLGAIINGISPLFSNPMGSGSVTINGGTIKLERVSASNPLTMNGGTLYSSNGWGATWSGPVTLNATSTVNAEWNMTLGGNISGAGGLTKTGGRTLYLSGTNSFTGNHKITAGTLDCSQAAALGTGSLDIATGAKVALNFTGTRTIAALTFNGGAPLAPGTYGSTSSPAYFTGTGTVTILPASTTTLALTVGATPANPGTPLTFTATVTGGSPTGSVAFYDGITLLGTSALNGAFEAGFTTSSLAIGSRSITARYVGNATNAASTSAAVTIEINSMVAAPPANLLATPGNNNIALGWTASAGAASYYVKRSLTNGGPYTVIGNPSGASYSDLTATNGTTCYYVLSAINGAGESANSSQVTAIPAATPSTTTLVSSPLGTGSYGSTVTFTATLTAGATGTVTFSDGATVLGTGTVNSGAATFATSMLPLANHSITATYGGDTTFGSSVSTPSAYLVTAKALTITGVTAANKVYDGNATAALTGGTISGGVTGGEVVTVVPGSGSFANPNAGTWTVTANGFAISGANAGNYTLAAQPAVPNTTITPRPVQLTGTRTYDATVIAAAGVLSISNSLDGGNVTLTGSAHLTAKDVGTSAIITTAAATRRQSAKGNTGANAAATISVSMAAAPVAGNTMIAVISTRGTSANIVTSITQTGVTNGTWVRAAQANNTSMTTEIWYAPNLPAGTGTAVTINQTSFRSAAVVMEYSGVLAGSPLDQIAPGNSVGSTAAAVTGTTTATTQANELWIGGIGFASNSPTLGSILNSFTSVDNAASTHGTAGNNARVYALERIVSSTEAASSGGTLSAATQWAGTMATFKTVIPSTLALAGSAAANYTLTGLTGSVAITPKALTLTTAPSVTSKTYDGLTTATLTGATLRVAETPGTGTSSDGTPYVGDTVVLVLSGNFNTKDAATGKTVTSTSTLAGAQMDNYTLTQPAGVFGDIIPAALTVTADNQSKTYGQALAFGSAATQFTSSGLLNGEMIASVTTACDGGDQAAMVALYPITPGAAIGVTFTPGNYTINYVPGLLTVNAAATTTTLTTSGNPSSYSSPVALTATVVPAPGNGAVQFYSDAVALGSPVPIDGGQAQLVTSSLTTGSHSITAIFSGSTNHNGSTATAMTQTVNAAQTPYSDWAAAPGQGLTAGVDDGPMDDPDDDGIANLLEFTLGGAPMVSSQGILPRFSAVEGAYYFEYDRSDASLSSTTQVVEYGSNLTGWTAITIPTTNTGNVTITPGTSSDHVRVAIPGSGTNIFARLKVTQ